MSAQQAEAIYKGMKNEYEVDFLPFAKQSPVEHIQRQTKTLALKIQNGMKELRAEVDDLYTMHLLMP
jgi:hypothetical protein